MAYTRVNPYIELVELLEELKITSANVGATPKISEDELLRAIDRASRWVDDYTGKDYFYHDYTVTAYELTKFDQRILGDTIFLPFANTISVTEVAVDETVLVVTDDYIVGQGQKNGQIFRVTGEWDEETGVSINGRFGYAQPASHPVTEEGDTANQLANWTLTGIAAATLYWQLASVAGPLARVRIYSDSGFANLVSQGTCAIGTGVTCTLTAQNSSGISGTVEVTYTQDDTDAANKLIPLDPVVDSTAVPTGVPQTIKTATRWVAAAMSGHNKLDGLDANGQPASIVLSEIPDKVFKLLGRAAPLLC